MTPWFLQRAHFGERCVMDPIGGIGDDLISVEEGIAELVAVSAEASLADCDVPSSAAIVGL